MTIKITYDHECDGCKTIMMTERYDCTSYPELPYPQPNKGRLMFLFGMSIDLCNECAQPLLEAKERMVERIILKRDAENERT